MSNNIISNIYFQRFVIDNENDFVYDPNQAKLQVISSDILVIEFENGALEIITLQNQKIEYSLNISYVANSNILKCNSDFSRFEDISLVNIRGSKIIGSKYLHLTNNKEIIIDGYSYEANTDHNLIGIKYELSNSCQIFIYSSDPEEINPNEIYIGRPSSALCFIYISNEFPKLESYSIDEFPIKYKVIKNDT